MTDPRPCWAVTYKPKLGGDPQQIKIEANGLVQALKQAQMLLTDKEGGPFTITGAEPSSFDEPVSPETSAEDGAHVAPGYQRPDTFVMRSVVSSNIDLIGYDAATRVMRVKFKNGTTYDHLRVSPEAHGKFVGAGSIGSHYNLYVHGMYSVSKVDS